MANKKPRPIFEGDKTPALLLVIAGVFVLLGGWLMWSHFIFGAPEQTFWGTVDASLQTYGVTKHVKQQSESGSGEQYLQVELGANNLARSITTLEENSANGVSSKVVTETVGGPEADYVRYTQVESSAKGPDGGSTDFSPVIGIWGKEDTGTAARSQTIFSEAIFGVIPFGHLSASQRKELVSSMRQNTVYEVDYKNAKRVDYNGKGAYEYEVSIKPDAYIAMLKQFDAMMGLNQLSSLDETQYRLSSPIELKMTVDINARQLLEVSFIQAGRTEQYSAYGARPNITVPDQYISRQELEQKLNAILQQ